MPVRAGAQPGGPATGSVSGCGGVRDRETSNPRWGRSSAPRGQKGGLGRARG